jgi:FkbM family methyltransferase
MLQNYFERKIKQVTTKVYDPLLKVAIGNQEIMLNLSHQLPEILKKYPDYNFNLARIVMYAEQHFGKVEVIDIGANVGDTVAFIRNCSNAPILCIDGEEHYVSLLKRNVAQYKDVSICQALVGTENKEEKIKLSTTQGTAQVAVSDKAVRVRTLENIVADYPAFSKSKILKTDTDGYDTLILRSSQHYLLNVKPILFFEFDPHFIRANGDDPFDFMEYLRSVGYQYFMCYTNVGDYLLSCTSAERTVMDDLIHYYSGRNIEVFMDICAFTEPDKAFFEKTRTAELTHYRQTRHY